MRDVIRRAGAIIAPLKELTVSEWADQYRRLPPEDSAEPGQWQTSRAEYQRGIMDAFSDPLVSQVVVMSSAQIGKTQILNNVAGYYIDQDPGPLLVIQPTVDMGEAWSKDRFTPMVRDTDCLRGKLGDPKAKISENTILHKRFHGGHLTVVGANSPSSLASRPIRIVLADEVDRYPVSAGTEGDPVSLAYKRTTTFWNRKIGLFSTPTVKGESRIEAAFEGSDKRFFHVPCPHCSEFQTLEWKNVRWPEGEPLAATYSCEFCGAVLDEADKALMVLKGQWRATGESSGVAGFFISELYSPWSTWGQMAASFLAAKNSQETLKTWINTSLGQCWEESGEKVDESSLMSRREDYPAAVPDGVLVITAGVDVQADRLEMEIRGWGLGEESWGIDYLTLHGDPNRPEVWQALEDVLGEQFTDTQGRAFPIGATCIDSGGHHTQIVYDFAKKHAGRRVFAIKGVGGPGIPVVSSPKARRSGRERRPVALFSVGVDQVKAMMLTRLNQTLPGPGTYHFPLHYDEEYFLQLTSERAVRKFRAGMAYIEWQKTRPRNEALDCNVYAYAAFRLLNPKLDRIAERLNALGKTGETRTETETHRQNWTSAPRRASGGFINSWRSSS